MAVNVPLTVPGSSAFPALSASVVSVPVLSFVNVAVVLIRSVSSILLKGGLGSLGVLVAKDIWERSLSALGHVSMLVVGVLNVRHWLLGLLRKRLLGLLMVELSSPSLHGVWNRNTFSNIGVESLGILFHVAKAVVLSSSSSSY